MKALMLFGLSVVFWLAALAAFGVDAGEVGIWRCALGGACGFAGSIVLDRIA